MSVACPACGRPNARRRTTCLYCGAELPEGGVEKAPVEQRSLPDEMDEWVRAALSGGGQGRIALDRLREALAGSREAAGSKERPDRSPTQTEGARGGASAPPAREPSSGSDALVAQPASAAGPVESLPPDLDAALASARAELDRISARTTDPAARRAAALSLRDAVERLITALPDGQPAPVVPLPPVHQPFALWVEGPGDPSRTDDLARALGVDAVTARAVAVSRCPRAAVRGSREDLVLLVPPVRSLGLGARLVGRDELAELGPAEAVLGGDLGELRLSQEPVWLAEPGAPQPNPDRVLVEPQVELIVPGEVVVRRWRRSAASRKKKTVFREVRERRIAVADLHGPGFHVRAGVGFTDFRGLPGAVEGSAVRSLRGLIESAAQTWPGVVVLARCTCRPLGGPRIDPEEESGELSADGWATWEEYTRACRLLHGV